MITLSNIYSREKTLFYFKMWNDSDRLGYEHFLGYVVRNNLFIIPPIGQKGSVWYSKDDLIKIDASLNTKISESQFESEIVQTLDSNWIKLVPYLTQGRKIKNANELLDYYTTLVRWWSAMNTVFCVPDKDSAPADFKKKILTCRSESERYTEQMNRVFVEFFSENVIKHRHLVSVLLPEEAAKIADNKMDQGQIELIEERLKGCFMYNQQVYPLVTLEELLKKEGLVLEQVKIAEVSEIKGRPAQFGRVMGHVKIVRIKADVVKITQGDILVTEMTNPDYVPYMKIAGAVVTDEGGATCHAAIASRELKIPCIVGTKIATKVLKDGMLVEVDANKGVVRIIK